MPEQGNLATVRGADLNEALENARKLAGGRPRVVGSRHVEANGFLGLVRRAWVELTVDLAEPAAVPAAASSESARLRAAQPAPASRGGEPAAPEFAGKKAALQATAREFLELHAAEREHNPGFGRPNPAHVPATAAVAAYAKSDGALDSLAIKHLSRKLEGVIRALDTVSRGGEDARVRGLPAPLQQEHDRMIGLDIPRGLARNLVLELGESLGKDAARPGVVRAELLKALAGKVPVRGPIVEGPGTRVVALVGPTGAGKTTTISKLAARYRLDGRKVGVVTLDTYRLAAEEQLRAASHRVRVPLAVARSPRELRAVMDGFQGADLVLVDTAGRNSKDAAAIRHEASLLAVARPDEVHLVLPATAQARFVREAFERYQLFAPTHTVLSKVDEAATLGGILGALADSSAGLSYLTVGQEIPADIEDARAERFARRLLGFEDAGMREAV